LLFTDDCALVAHTQDSEQQFFDRFAKASSRFRLTFSLKNTEVLQQSPNKEKYSAPVIQAGGTVLKSEDRFCYLGSLLTNAASMDDEVSARLAKASAAFGRLIKCLWNDYGIRHTTKMAAFQPIIHTTLLYGCESWTPYRRHIAKLDQFHLRSLRKIAHQMASRSSYLCKTISRT